MSRDSRTVYAASVYHDTATDAAVDSKHIAYYDTLSAATKAVNRFRDDHWQTGEVCKGTLYAPVFGTSPEEFESDLGQTYFVGTDGKAVR